MGLIRLMERGGSDYSEYKKAVKAAKKAIETICDLTEEMEEKFSERSGMSSSYRDDYDEERRMRRRHDYDD